MTLADPGHTVGADGEKGRPGWEAAPRSLLASLRITAPSLRPLLLVVLFQVGDQSLVVSISPAMLAAFCSAVRTTFRGSMIPALNISTYLPL